MLRLPVAGIICLPNGGGGVGEASCSLPWTGGRMTDINSRGWTGPAPEPAPADRHAAHAAFLAAGSPAAARPQRVAAAACWTGLVLLPFVVLLGADDRSWPPGLPAAGDAFRAMLDAWLEPSIGSKGVEGVVAVLGDPRVPALLLALAGSIAGMASAWRHRAALTRGFQAASPMAA